MSLLGTAASLLKCLWKSSCLKQKYKRLRKYTAYNGNLMFEGLNEWLLLREGRSGVRQPKWIIESAPSPRICCPSMDLNQQSIARFDRVVLISKTIGLKCGANETRYLVNTEQYVFEILWIFDANELHSSQQHKKPLSVFLTKPKFTNLQVRVHNLVFNCASWIRPPILIEKSHNFFPTNDINNNL